MAKIRKRKLRWSPSSSPDVVGYKLYWAVGGRVHYHSDSIELGRSTEAILPDDVPSFPLVNAEVELGVTAITEIGNESDMARLSSPVRFGAPDAPADLVLETVQDYFIDENSSS